MDVGGALGTALYNCHSYQPYSILRSIPHPLSHSSISCGMARESTCIIIDESIHTDTHIRFQSHWDYLACADRFFIRISEGMCTEGDGMLQSQDCVHWRRKRVFSSFESELNKDCVLEEKRGAR